MDGERVHRGGVWDRSNVKPDTDHIKNPKQREKEIVRILDNIGFNWTVFIAVSFGFLASSYIIFSSNIIGPTLQYVYPAQENREFVEPGLEIDLATIGTTTLGMIVFGHLADRLGRKRLYGLELFIIIIGTVGVIQSSDGYVEDGQSSLSLYTAVSVWRGIQGLGIGAEYPLSAIIAAEFASTQTRGTLMASIFAMQSLGRILAYAVVLGALGSVDPDDADSRIKIDQTWRLVVGISAVPAMLAIGLRLTIPETPRYYTGIEKNLKKAVEAVERVGGKPDDLQSIHSDVVPTRRKDSGRSAPWFSSAWNYFKQPMMWRSLAGISLLWFLLDIAFYGLGLDSPTTLNRLMASSSADYVANCTVAVGAPTYTTATLTLEGGVKTTLTQLIAHATDLPSVTSTLGAETTNLPWNEDPGSSCENRESIASTLKTTATRTLLVSSIASGVGSIAAIFIINYFSRRRLMAVTSGILCLLFLAAGFSVWKAVDTPSHFVSVVFFALTQFMFNLGPNTLTFIIAAESFPTIFRGTAYGIAAASGKIGALVIRRVLYRVKGDKSKLMGVLFGFCGVTLLMAGISLLPGWIVEIQHPRVSTGSKTTLENAERGWKRWLPRPLKNKTLEEIAPNPEPRTAEDEGNEMATVAPGKRTDCVDETDGIPRLES